MATVSESLGKTLELLWDIWIYGAKKTFKKIESTATIYIKALVKCTTLCIAIFFVSIILKSLTGWVYFAYIGVFPSILLTIALILLASPLGILFGMIKEETVNPATAGDSYFKFVTAVFFIELLAFIYVIEFPVNLETTLKMTVLGIALAVGIYRFGSIFPPKLYNVMIMGTMAYTTLSIFDPNPVGFVLNGFNHTYSTYQGLRYDKEEVIIVSNKGEEFSEVITLYGDYNVVFKGWAHFKQKGSNEHIVVNSSQDFNYPSLKNFRVRSQFGLVAFTPINNE
ncbi:MAG: hypothetical protein Q8Q90_03675 [bacterium]|nr:hypothetical protein [bacterium]